MKKEDNKVISEAHERYDLAVEASAEFRKQAKEDLEFVDGDQWTQAARKLREDSGQPVHTVNKMKAFLQQITNEMRQNTPSIQVDPQSDGADKDSADLYGGLIRHIEVDSQADTAYDTAGWYAAAIGKGYFRLAPEYESEDSFDQKLVIKTIEDPSTVFFDPNSKEADGSDAEYAFVVTDIPKDTFKQQYGESKMGSAMTTGDWEDVSVRPNWLSDSTVRIAEYFYKEHKTITLYAVKDLATGQTVVSTDAPPEHYLQDSLDEFGQIIPAQAELIGKRKSVKTTVKWCKINGCEILEETVWPGKRIPVFPVTGDEKWINGQRKTSGIIKDAKDSQRAYNWYASVQTEMVAMAPKAPFIGEKGAFAGFESRWRDANVKNFAYLEYNGKDAKGNPIAPPARQTMEAPIQAVSASRMQAADDIKSVVGIFDASLGAQGNEVSGKAILARTQQSHTTTFHFFDNLKRTITSLGRELVEVIPHFYDTERVVQIVKPNNERHAVTINQPQPDGSVKNDLTTGKYSVVIETGPSYATRRQDAATHMMALMDNYKEAAPLVADLVVHEMDWPGAELIAKRLRAAVPPEVLAATGEGDDEKMEPAQKVQLLTQQLQQQKQQLEALNAHAAQVEQMLKLKDQEARLLKEDKEIDRMKAELDFRTKNRQLANDEETTKLEFMIKQEELRLAAEKLELEKGKLAISAVDSMHAMNKDAHDLHPDTRMADVDVTANDPDLGGKFE